MDLVGKKVTYTVCILVYEYIYTVYTHTISYYVYIILFF